MHSTLSFSTCWPQQKIKLGLKSLLSYSITFKFSRIITFKTQTQTRVRAWLSVHTRQFYITSAPA